MQPLEPNDPTSLGGFVIIGRLWSSGQVTTFAAAGERRVLVDAWATSAGPEGDFDGFLDSVAGLLGIEAAPIAGGVDGPWAWVATPDRMLPSLAEDVAASGALGPLSWSRLAADLVREIAAIHERGLVVGRITPTDVVVDKDAGQLRTAAALYAAFRGDRAALNPPLEWMPPEMLAGQEPSARSDVFCLGAVLSYAATGREPWGAAGTPAATLVTRITSGDADLGGVDDARLGPLHRMLDSDPAVRPVSGRLAELFIHVAPVEPDEPSAERESDPPAAAWEPPPTVAEPEAVASEPVVELPRRPREIAPPDAYDSGGARGRDPRRRMIVAGAVAGVLLVAGTAAFAVSRGGSSDGPTADSAPAAPPASSAPPSPSSPAAPSPSPTPSPTPVEQSSVRVNYQSSSIPDKVFVNTLDWTFDVCSTDASLTASEIVSKVGLYRRVGDSWERVPATPTAIAGGRCGAKKVNLTLDASAQAPSTSANVGEWSTCVQYRVVIPATKRFAKTYVDMCLQVKRGQL